MLILDENHQYFLNDKPIPGFSEILGDLGIVNLSFINPELLQEKAALGTSVHEATEKFDLGTLDEWNLDACLEPFLEAYKAFKDQYKPTVVEVEKPCYGSPVDVPGALYACTLDRIFDIDGEIIVVDIKSGSKQRTTELQTAANLCAYNHTANLRDFVTSRAALYLSSDGTFHLKRHPSDKDISDWMACVQTFWYKHKNYKGKK